VTQPISPPNGKTIGSLFAGIGGFDLGFERAGFATKWTCEIDPKAQAVLRLRFPHATHHDDVTQVGAHNLEPVDVVTFGSPCQDLSVAGKRAGLAGERSGLFHAAVDVISGLRAKYGKPDFAIWENVPGAFSSNSGRDFAAVIDALADIGARDIAWRVLDSRFFGVAQRRRRVFLVVDFGGERAAEVLALAQGGSGHPAPRRQARKGSSQGSSSSLRASRVEMPIAVASGQANAEIYMDGSAPTLTRLQDTPYITHVADVSGTLCALDGPKGVSDQYAHEGKLVAMTMQPTANTLDASYYKGTGNRHGSEREFVAIGFYAKEGSHGMGDNANVSPAIKIGSGLGIPSLPAVAFNISPGRPGEDAPASLRAVQTEVAHAVTVTEHAKVTDQGTRVVFSPTLTASNDPSRSPQSQEITQQVEAVHKAASVVRRLTPIECCRLQGFPDDWNGEGIDKTGKRIQMADAPRYRQLGNAVTVNVAQWIANNLARVYDASQGAPDGQP
jgi:DNA (cytosine-5)-methyltransferase 1